MTDFITRVTVESKVLSDAAGGGTVVSIKHMTTTVLIPVSELSAEQWATAVTSLAYDIIAANCRIQSDGSTINIVTGRMPGPAMVTMLINTSQFRADLKEVLESLGVLPR